MAIGGHVAIVLLEAAGEAVVPVAITHKIKEFCVLGVERCFQGTPARIANRTRRQSRNPVRIVG